MYIFKTFGTDSGINYDCTTVRSFLSRDGFLQSMSGKGNCYDNAYAESFFHTLKTELIYQNNYLTREDAKQDIFEYIEVFYNRKRRHSALGYLSPEQFEKKNLRIAA
ncbi:MAG: IS3 family transposase [Calditrichaeota bacterium]|nr:IS3 family transposase [Calditrichota bacterium]